MPEKASTIWRYVVPLFLFRSIHVSIKLFLFLLFHRLDLILADKYNFIIHFVVAVGHNLFLFSHHRVENVERITRVNVEQKRTGDLLWMRRKGSHEALLSDEKCYMLCLWCYWPKKVFLPYSY